MSTSKRGASVSNTLWQCGDSVSSSPYGGYRMRRGLYGFADSEDAAWHNVGEVLFRAIEDTQKENDE